ncbi:MAG: phage portal protein [Rhizobiales bacterium]|nr:phage portal protein [Hyphomicrobiales bacterium]
MALFERRGKAAGGSLRPEKGFAPGTGNNGGSRSTATLEAKASRAGPLVYLQSNGQPVWTVRDYASLAREGFTRNVIAYRAVRMVAEAVGSVPFMLSEAGERLDTHPLLDVLRNPNERQSGSELLEAITCNLLLAGNAYLEGVALDGNLRELHALRPDRVRVVPGADGWPEAYVYAVAGGSVRFDQTVASGGAMAPILHLSFYHPLDDHYGFAPIEAAQTALDIHNVSSAWNKALLDNAARPSGALVYQGGEGNLTEEQFDRLKAELEESFQGARNAGRPLLLEGGLDWKAMSLSPHDMDFQEARNAAAREIALAFGVPPQLLGIPGDNTYSNYQEANRAFWRQTILPLLRRTAQSIESWTRHLYGAGLELNPDESMITALASERDQMLQRVVTADFLTVNEKRKALGYAPVENGDALPDQE